MSTPTTRALRGSVANAALALVVIHVVGTIGVYVIADGKASVFDAFYMTFITVGAPDWLCDLPPAAAPPVSSAARSGFRIADPREPT